MRFSAFVKSLAIAFLFFSFFSFTASVSFAQGTTAQKNKIPPSTNADPDVPRNLHNWTQSVMIETMLSLTCQLVGVDPTRPDGQCLGVDQKTGKIGFLPARNPQEKQIGGVFGGLNNMITMLFSPPIHASDYFQNLAQNFGITKKAYAQTTGSGFDSLNPLMGIWATFRNVVYLFLIIVFVIIGLAIMLRVKIDPRTVMTIQNQIPKIIIGILAVTFSFAIAGFLIDMMWVFIYLIFNLVSGASADIAASVSGLNPTSLQGQSPLGIGIGEINSMAASAATGAKESITTALGIRSEPADYVPFVNTLTLGLVQSAQFLINPASFITDGGLFEISRGLFFGFPSLASLSGLIDIISTAGGIFSLIKIIGWENPNVTLTVFGIGGSIDLGWITNIPVAGIISAVIYDIIEAFFREALPWLIAYIVIMIALLAALFRLWFTLLMAYVQILLDIVLAPFWIIGGIIPGSPISFGGWVRDMAANLLAFPAVIFLFLLGKVFMNGFDSATNPFVPPLIGNASPGMLSSLIGIGIILITPNVVNMLKQALKAPKMDTGLGKAFGVGPAVLMGGMKTTASAGMSYVTGDPFTRERGASGALRTLGRKFLG